MYVANLLQWGVCSMKSPVVKRSIILAGRKTSVSLEDAFWTGLKEIAGKRLMTLSTLVGTIDAQRQQGKSLIGASAFCAQSLSRPGMRHGSPLWHS